MSSINTFILRSILTGIIVTLTSTVVLADDAAVACKASSFSGVPVRTSVFGSTSFACTDLQPAGDRIMQTCAQASRPNTPNCGITFWSDTPADTVLQCSASGVSGPPDVLYKYVLCQTPVGGYYWALLADYDSSISLTKKIPQSKP